MIAPAVLVAFFLGLIAETIFVIVTDRRAIAKEQAYWAELSADAADGYGRVFDWERDA